MITTRPASQRHPMALTFVAGCSALVVPAHLWLGLARAEEPTRVQWSPGRRTSGEIQGGVEPSEGTSESDGLYGRLDGDLAVRIAVGPDYSSSGLGLGTLAAADYFYTLGLTIGYARAFQGAAPRNRLAAGIELRPLFLPRWSQDWDRGPAWLDLTIDSLTLDAGLFRDWGGPRATESSVGFEAGIGLGAPLSSRAAGPWLECRGVRRWQFDSEEPDPADWSVWVGLGWQLFLETALVSETAD